MGRRPYDGRSRREIRNQILAKQAFIRQEMIPKGWSLEAADFTNRLIQRKPYKRLGKQGIHELKNHSWFKGFDWKGLENKTIKPPFIPNIKNVFEYLRNLTEDFTEADSSMENSIVVRRNTFQKMFDGYDCFAGNEKKKKTTSSNANLEKNKSKPTQNSDMRHSTKKVVKEELKAELKEVPKRLSQKKLKAVSPLSSVKPSIQDKIKKRSSMKKKSVEKSSEKHNKSFYPKSNPRKSLNKKKKSASKNLSREVLHSKQIAKTLKKNNLVDSKLTVDMKESKKGKIKSLQRRSSKKDSQNLNNISWKRKNSKDQSKMGVLGKHSSIKNWENMSRKSRNVRHVIKKRSALNRSLNKKSKKKNSIYLKPENRVNLSMNPKMSPDTHDLGYLPKSRQSKSKNDLKGYLSLNSKHFYESSKKTKDKKKTNTSIKKHSKIIKLKNPRKLVIGRGYYVSPQFDRKTNAKNSNFMSSLNYSRFGNKRGYKHNSFSKQSKRSRDQIQESLCFGGDFGKRMDLQESLRKASFNGTFFEKMKKFGKKRLQQGRVSDKKHLSIYLSHNNNNLRKKRMRSQKASQVNYLNSGNLLWNKRKRPQLGLNLTMMKKAAFNEGGQSMTLLENQRSGKNSFRLSKQAFTRGDIYRQLDEFEKLKYKRGEMEGRIVNSRGSRKGSAFRKKGDLIREIAEITQSLSCTSNLKKLTAKLQNKENSKQLEKLAQTDGLNSFYKRDQRLRQLRKRSQKQSKRREFGTINSNLGISSSGLN